MLMRLAQEADVPILTGTDVGGPESATDVPGSRSMRNSRWMSRKGLTPLTVLQGATLNPAKLLHATDSLGTWRRGSWLIWCARRHPLAEITNTTMIRAGGGDGRYYDRTALDGLLAEVQAKAKEEPDSLVDRPAVRIRM
jgi:imidazolonepropionase-like amidohydrolase